MADKADQDPKPTDDARRRRRRRRGSEAPRNSESERAQPSVAGPPTSADSDDRPTTERSSRRSVAEPSELEDINVGTLVEGLDPQAVRAGILDLYRRSIRDYIGNALEQEYGNDWLEFGVIKHANSSTKNRLRRESNKLPSGESPLGLLDLKDFEWIIGGNDEVFPERLRDDNATQLFERIYTARNKGPGHDHSNKDAEAHEVEEFARDCASMLQLCRLSQPVNEIRRRLRGYDVLRYIAPSPVPAREAETFNDETDALRQRGPEAQSKTEGTEQGGEPAPPPDGFKADPERHQQRSDERARLEAAAATEQLGHEQRAPADAGEARRIASSTQGGPSDGGGGPGAATLAGAGDEDRSPPVGEEGDLQKPGKRWRPSSRAARIQMIVGVMAFAIIVALIVALIVATWLDGSPPAVAPAIDGNISCEPISPMIGEAVKCTAALRGGEPTSWSWSVDGNSTSQSWNSGDPPYGDQPAFETTFSSPGSYELTLTVANDADRVSASRNIEVLPPAPTINSEELECSPATPKVGDRITCTAPLGGGEPDSWTWSGGGEPDSRSWNSGDPPYGDQPTFETTFSSPGSYELTLTVANDADRVSASHNIEVLPPAPTINSEEFKCSPATPKVGELLRCSVPLGGGEPDSWTWSGGGEPDSRSWNSGDPPYGDQPTFETTFSSPGSYELTLTVANDADRVSASRNIEVLPPAPTINSEELKCLPETPKVGERIRCTAPLGGGDPDSWTWSGGGDPDSQSWNRGDPPYGDQPAFETTFSSPGSYELTLTVENTGGDNSAVVAVQVRELPLPPPPPVIDHIICEPASPVVGEEVSCSAELSGGEPASWSWSGGDDPPTGQQRSFTTAVRSAGELTISLTVENAGDDDTESFELRAEEPCLESDEGDSTCGGPPDGPCLEDGDGNPNCAANAGTETDSTDGESMDDAIMEGDSEDVTLIGEGGDVIGYDDSDDVSDIMDPGDDGMEDDVMSPG